MRARHGGHSRQLNPVFNDVVDFAVTEILCGFGVQIRDAGIDICADGGPSPSIDAMTGGATREKVFAALLDRGPIVGIRVLQTALLPRNRKVAYRSRSNRLKS